MPRRAYAGAAPETTLASDITAASTTITGTDFTGYPSPTGGKLAAIVIDPGLASEEKIEYDTRTGNTLTGCLRGRDGTTAAAHVTPAKIRHIFLADDAETGNAHVFDTALDAHTQYLNTTRHDTTARHGSSVVDHGSIGGLADDDHTQYYNAARHTAALHNALVRPCVRVTNSGTQSLAHGAFTAITFDTESFDTDTIHSTASNTSRLTAVTAGKYRISGVVRFSANGTGQRAVTIRLNGTTGLSQVQVQANTVGGGQTMLAVSTTYTLAIGDYVELTAFQDSGVSLTSEVAGGAPHFEMELISA